MAGETASAGTTAAYWDAFAGAHLNSPAHWEANEAVRRFQWKLVTGDAELNPVTWFMEKYGPFASLASLCSGTGLLERHVANRWLRSAGQITGFDISPHSVELAREAAKGIRGVAYEVRDLDHAAWSGDRYDAVFAHGALHHVSRLDFLLGQLRQCLSPSGYLYVNDYVGPARFQWSDLQMRLANELLKDVPAQFVHSRSVVRCNPDTLAKSDPSEAVCSNFILDTVRGHFQIVEKIDRGGTLLAPIFGSGCLDPVIVASGQGLAAINELCERELALLQDGVIPSDHVVVIARLRAAGSPSR
jgi:SAM-dependent methyltransferase